MLHKVQTRKCTHKPSGSTAAMRETPPIVFPDGAASNSQTFSSPFPPIFLLFLPFFHFQGRSRAWSHADNRLEL